MSKERFCPFCGTRLAERNPNKYCFAHTMIGANADHINFRMRQAINERNRRKKRIAGATVEKII
ncbi:hypothetical protein [Sulfuricurvum sp.]|uniref:hypothetical protein n=1 Tax=Sulfuricurvum sp. TaxID=2025608 RepID=UPI0035629C8E